MFSLVTAGAQECRLFTNEDGLSSTLINNIFCDSKGNIWVSTEYGLNRFNGVGWHKYLAGPDSTSTIADNFVRCVGEDGDGNIFVQTYAGVQRYDRDSDSFSPVASMSDGSRMGPLVNFILADDGHLMAISNVLIDLHVRDGIVVCDVADFQRFPSGTQIFLEDSQRNIWGGRRGKGIIRLRPDGSFKEYDMSSARNLSGIFEDNKGHIYVTDIHNGIYFLDYATDSFVNLVFDEPVSVRSFFQNGDDILVGTEGDWIKVLDPESRKIEDYPLAVNIQNLTSLKVHCITKDKFGNIWLALYQKGVLMIPSVGNEFGYIGPKSVARDIIGSSAVSSLYRTADGTLWVGTDNDGVYGVDTRTFKARHYPLKRADNPIKNSVFGLFEDSRGRIWFGTFANGCGYFDPKTGACRYLDLTTPGGIAVSFVSSFAEDESGTIWIGAMNGGGLIRYNPDNGEVTYLSEQIRGLSRHISDMDFGSDGRLYVSSFFGAYAIDMGDSISVRRIGGQELFNTVYKSSSGKIWFGGEDGIMLYDPVSGNTENITTADGLPSNLVYGILEDESGEYWISTNEGLIRYNPRNKAFVNFVSEDGIQGNEFSKNATWADKDGYLWFGGNNGITYFRPADIKLPVRNWHIKIVQLLADENNIPVSEAIKVPYNENNLSVIFTTEEYDAPSRLVYEYDWDETRWVSLPAGQRRVSINNLSPGNHKLSIRVKDNNLHSGMVSVDIHVCWPWWLQWWSISLLLLALSGIVAFVRHVVKTNMAARRQIARLAEEEQITQTKLQTYTSLSHELRTPISLIINPLGKIMREDDNPEHQKSYKIMMRNSERILQVVNQLMDSRKIDRGKMKMSFRKTDIIPYIQKICENFEDQFAMKQLSFHYDHEGLDSLDVWIDQSNFDKVIYNLLSNAVKFTPSGGEIGVEVKKDADHAHIDVTDTGIGISPEDRGKIFERFYQASNGKEAAKGGTGIGLHLVKSLVELHHGTVTAEPNEGIGTRFSVAIPLGCGHLSEDEIAAEMPEGNLIHESVDEYARQILAADTSSEEERVYPSMNYKILIADDDDDLRSYLKGELSKKYHVIETRNGREALSAIFDKQPDLVISDVIMPEMDGLRLCREIRRNINLNHIPVILLTAKSENEDTINGMITGADAYLTKPFNMGVLLSTVDNLLRSRHMLQNKFNGGENHDDEISDISMKSPDEQLMDRVMRFLNENLSNSDLTIDYMASEIGISRAHLYRKLNEITNQPAARFIRNTRLSVAAKLLSEKKYPVSEIAYKVGFQNPDYFATAFKKFYGVSPSQYAADSKAKEL